MIKYTNTWGLPILLAVKPENRFMTSKAEDLLAITVARRFSIHGDIYYTVVAY